MGALFKLQGGVASQCIHPQRELLHRHDLIAGGKSVLPSARATVPAVAAFTEPHAALAAAPLTALLPASANSTATLSASTLPAISAGSLASWG